MADTWIPQRGNYKALSQKTGIVRVSSRYEQPNGGN